MKVFQFLLIITLAAVLCSQPAPPERVGPLPGGGFLLNSGWKLQPAGKQVPVDTLPMSFALSPDGRYLLVLNGGYNPPSISVIEVSSAREAARVRVADGWLGLTFSPKGDRVYLGGGSRAAVFEFSFSEGNLQPTRTFLVVAEEKRTNRDFVGDVALSPDGRLVYAADLYHDSVLVINPQSGMVIDRFKTGRRPYRILFHPDGKSFFVTSWADGSLGHYETANGNLLARIRLGPHPTDMVWHPVKYQPEEEGELGWAARIFVAAANTNSVYALAISEGKDLRLAEVINVALTARQPVGMTPSALALSPDLRQLYVVCSDANTVAVVDLSQEHSLVKGFIPTAWYPTAARALKDGGLAVLNGKGQGSHANPQGPSPVRRPEPVHLGIKSPEYVARIQTGTISWIPPVAERQLDAFTQTVLANSAYRDSKLDTPHVLPPIEHVVYVVKENRTYDQVLGDIAEGNGDPSLVLFGEKITPNHHKLAREFVLLDNFYVNSDVSADGHNWSTAAIAPDYVQKMWPNSYAGRRKLYDYEGQEPTATPPAGYIWTNAAMAGISMRNYGYFVNNRATAGPGGVQVQSVRDPVLARVTNMRYRGFDLTYPDVDRAKVFLEDLAEFEKTGQMPRLLLLRLGNDHTSGTAPGRIAPRSAVADNDYALGMIVDGLSKSKFWPTTAIFVLEDDAQNGPDHVDSHRSPAYVISPYVKRKAIDRSLYNTTSVLRTMELLLGLRPMTHFDAGARPLTAVFQTQPDLRSYTAEKPRISLDEVNPAASDTASRSERLDLSEADRIDDDELNDILWRAIKGTQRPPPVRSFFAR